MSEFDVKSIEATSLSPDGFKPYVKSPVIWGHIGNKAFPLCYLTKPRWISQEQFNDFLDMFTYQLERKQK